MCMEQFAQKSSSFPTGTLVWHNDHGVGIALPIGNKTHISVTFYRERVISVPVSELRTLTFKEFMYHRLPDGKRMVGKHGLFAAGLRYGAFLAMSIGGFSVLGQHIGWLALALLPLGVIALMIKGAHENWEGRQM